MSLEPSLADGKLRSSRNDIRDRISEVLSLADGKLRSSRNEHGGDGGHSVSLADGKLRSSRIGVAYRARPAVPALEKNCMGRELVGGLGFEPRLAESESAVLPLDDPPDRHRSALAVGRRLRGVGGLIATRGGLVKRFFRRHMGGFRRDFRPSERRRGRSPAPLLLVRRVSPCDENGL